MAVLLPWWLTLLYFKEYEPCPILELFVAVLLDFNHFGVSLVPVCVFYFSSKSFSLNLWWSANFYVGTLCAKSGRGRFPKKNILRYPNTKQSYLLCMSHGLNVESSINLVELRTRHTRDCIGKKAQENVTYSCKLS